MLRRIRIVLGSLCLLLLTGLFLDFTGTLHVWFGWLAKIQLLPALLALQIGVVLTLVALTLLCGRVYCSVICPLGVFQDVVSWLIGRRKRAAARRRRQRRPEQQRRMQQQRRDQQYRPQQRR